MAAKRDQRDEIEDEDEDLEEVEIDDPEEAEAELAATTDDDDDDQDDDTSLDQLLSQRAAARRGGDDTDSDDDIMALASEKEPRGSVEVPLSRIVPVKDRQEFVCRRCYLVKARSQLSDTDRMLCRDCA